MYTDPQAVGLADPADTALLGSSWNNDATAPPPLFVIDLSQGSAPEVLAAFLAAANNNSASSTLDPSLFAQAPSGAGSVSGVSQSAGGASSGADATAPTGTATQGTVMGVNAAPADASSPSIAVAQPPLAGGGVRPAGPLGPSVTPQAVDDDASNNNQYLVRAWGPSLGLPFKSVFNASADAGLLTNDIPIAVGDLLLAAKTRHDADAGRRQSDHNDGWRLSDPPDGRLVQLHPGPGFRGDRHLPILRHRHQPRHGRGHDQQHSYCQSLCHQSGRADGPVLARWIGEREPIPCRRRPEPGLRLVEVPQYGGQPGLPGDRH